MPNARDVSVLVTIGGEKYRLAYDLNAEAAYAKEMGKELFTTFVELFVAVEAADAGMAQPPNVGSTETSALAWAGLSTHHPNLTLREFRAGLTVSDVHDLVEAVRLGIAKYFSLMPKPEQVPEDFPTSGPSTVTMAQ